MTYGYCAAPFSGASRADLADAIVASGRSCLEDAVRVAGGAGAANPVKYGDTDSIFVEMAGASVAQALDRAHEISKTVFAGTPPAVHLKVEYVFDGCALVSKKRYVGRAVEAPGDTPHLLVKGLELKTRDQCDFVRERLEAVVRDVLATRDLSRAKRTLQRAVVGVEACPLQDLILWRRYRGEGAYKTNRHDLVGPVKELDARGNRTAAKDRVGARREGPGLTRPISARAPRRTRPVSRSASIARSTSRRSCCRRCRASSTPAASTPLLVPGNAETAAARPLAGARCAADRQNYLLLPIQTLHPLRRRRRQAADL